MADMTSPRVKAVYHLITTQERSISCQIRYQMDRARMFLPTREAGAFEILTCRRAQKISLFFTSVFRVFTFFGTTITNIQRKLLSRTRLSTHVSHRLKSLSGVHDFFLEIMQYFSRVCGSKSEPFLLSKRSRTILNRKYRSRFKR